MITSDVIGGAIGPMVACLRGCGAPHGQSIDRKVMITSDVIGRGVGSVQWLPVCAGVV